jgi:acetyltransferase-like isoleucine patch superfamily enzyme
MAYLSKEELEKIGFKSVGEEVYVSDKASIYNASKIVIGSFVRIDDFSLISAGDEGIEIGSYVHISCYVCLIGKAKITISDFVSVSIKATILSSNSDFSGDTLPYLSEFQFNDIHKGLLSVISKPVVLETHTGIGAHSVILPGVTIGKGSVIGAQSVVYESVNQWGIYFGNPVRFLKKRSDVAYNRTQEILKEQNGDKT